LLWGAGAMKRFYMYAAAVVGFLGLIAVGQVARGDVDLVRKDIAELHASVVLLQESITTLSMRVTTLERAAGPARTLVEGADMDLGLVQVVSLEAILAAWERQGGETMTTQDFTRFARALEGKILSSRGMIYEILSEGDVIVSMGAPNTGALASLTLPEAEAVSLRLGRVITFRGEIEAVDYSGYRWLFYLRNVIVRP